MRKTEYSTLKWLLLVLLILYIPAKFIAPLKFNHKGF
jgi:hypothetical protein